MIFNIGSKKDPTNKEDIKSILLHLEDEYRKANISERDYAELKQKYTEELRKIDKSFDRKFSEQEDVEEEPKIDRKKEREEISMFLGSLEEEFRRGEINKEEYESIRDINLERLNDILDESKEVAKTEEEIQPEKIKPEIEKEERGGIFQRLFGKSKNQKEKAKEMAEEVKIKTEEGSEEVELQLKKEEPQNILDESRDVDATEQKIEKMPEEMIIKSVEPEKIENPIEEKPKKGGFLKSLFGKKGEKPTEQPKEEAPKEEPKQEETKVEEVPKEEPKPEEKKLEVGEIEEVTPEVIEKLASQMAEEGGGPEIEEPEETAEPEAEEITKDEATNKLGIEIEKLKVMLDAVRESKRSTDDTIQNLSENIGEIRSLIMQTDANFKTSLSKMEKMEDDISEVRPKEITKRFNEIKENLEKNRLEMEKMKQKIGDVTEKVNEIQGIIKVIGDVENLTNLNNSIQTKLKDISEAIKYIQRIGTRTEKIFIDLSKGLEDLVLLKAKQEDYDESLKNVLESIDSFNVKLKDYVTKDDLNIFREESLIIKKQIDEIKKILPVADLKLPENIINLRKEREDIEMFLESLEMQFANDQISKAEYEDVRRSNLKKLSDIENKLEKEWENVNKMLKGETKEEAPKEEEPPKEKKKEVKIKKLRKRTRKKESSEKNRKKKILSDLKKINV